VLQQTQRSRTPPGAGLAVVPTRSLHAFVARVALAVSLLSAASGTAQKVRPHDLDQYVAAIEDARKPTQAKISTSLLALAAERDPVNDRRLFGSPLVTREIRGLPHVLVTVFMTRDSYDRFYRANLESHLPEYTLEKSLFVALVPELKNRFIEWRREGKHWFRTSSRECPPSPLRVVQLLGLNPVIPYEILLEMWVPVNALFRPSPDPEPWDHEAQLLVQNPDGSWAFPADRSLILKLDDSVLFKEGKYPKNDMNLPVPYRKWFIDRLPKAYDHSSQNPADWGYPFTQLGYTYDWGDPDDHVGLSELIVRIDPCKGAEPQDACRNGGELTVTLESAYDVKNREWGRYFRCDPELQHER